jgi:F-type H+-transporting ATPase subunit b
MLESLLTALPLAQEAAAGSEDEGGNFLVTPEVGLMIWTLLAFGATLWILRRYAFPRIQEALDKRQKSIEEAIAHSERARAEADKLLDEYRIRLREAREQAEEIVVRARKAGEEHERESLQAARQQREELLEQTRRDVEAEIRAGIQQIRAEIADLTVLATERVTRKVLTPEDQQQLVEEALSEIDFSALTGEAATNGKAG